MFESWDYVYVYGVTLTLQPSHSTSGAGHFVAAVSSPQFGGHSFVAAVSSRVHFVASHFVAGTLRRLPFGRGTLRRLPFGRWDTSSLEHEKDGGIRLSSKT